jgi:chromosome partitioning protein
MCTVVAIAGEKGGTGKTTLAINIAAELHARGKRVLLVDADPQGTAITWAGIGGEAEIDGPATIAMGDNLRAQLGRAAEGYDWCIIDCAGRGGKRQVGALMVADLVLLPCGPSPADAWALGASVDLVAEVIQLRPELRAAIVLNRTNRTAIGRSTRNAIAELTTTLPTLATAIGDRVAFREALASGTGVTGYASGSVAANELRRLVDEIEELAQREAA